MNKFLSIISMLLIAFLFSNCEKDDLCAATTPTTPRLVLEFFDEANPTVAKNVKSLKVYGLGRPDSIGIYNGINKLKLPLNTVGNTTTYKLVLNSTIANAINTDYLEVNYASQNIFVSRACGYKSVFKINPIGGVLRTDSESEDGIWMKSILVTNRSIESEDDTHIKIYF